MDGDGQMVLDEDGNAILEQAGWCVLRDQAGMVLWDKDGHMCMEEVNEEELVLQTRPVPRQATESLVEMNQRLQNELEQLRFEHQNDVERTQVELDQKSKEGELDR